MSIARSWPLSTPMIGVNSHCVIVMNFQLRQAGMGNKPSPSGAKRLQEEHEVADSAEPPANSYAGIQSKDGEYAQTVIK